VKINVPPKLGQQAAPGNVRAVWQSVLAATRNQIDETRSCWVDALSWDVLGSRL